MIFAMAFCFMQRDLSMYFNAYIFRVRLCSTTLTCKPIRGKDIVKTVIYLAKGTPSYSTVEFKVVEIDLSIEVDGLRETATHLAQDEMAVRNEGRKYNGLKYKFLGLVPIGQTEPP